MSGSLAGGLLRSGDISRRAYAKRVFTSGLFVGGLFKSGLIQATLAHTFVPIGVETFGSWGPEATAFISDLGRRVASISGETRSLMFLRQRIDIALQRGNSASV